LRIFTLLTRNNTNMDNTEIKSKRVKHGFRPLTMWISDEAHDKALRAAGYLTLTNGKKMSTADAINYLIEKAYENLNIEKSA
jgi:hypothetical protein